MTTVETTARNAELSDLVGMLQRQADVRYDVVTNAAGIRFENGQLVVVNGAHTITDDGVTPTDAVLAPTDVFDEGIAEKLGIPRPYVRRLRDEAAPDLLDHNVNEWLDRDSRQFLVRGFRTDDPNETGIARAFLSDRYQAIDNLDVLLAALDGIRQAGVEVEISGADLSERMMRVNVVCPAIEVYAESLLQNYRSPFTGQSGREIPVVWAGFQLRNSETGGGAYSLVPRIVFRVCTNGMTMTKDAVRQVHLGGRLDEGIVRWSGDTLRKNLELVVSQTRDSVTTFLDREYVESVIARVEENAAAPVTDAVPTIERVGKRLGFTKSEQDSILSHFISGADPTAHGVLQAVTATAQTVENPDRVAVLEDSAFDAMALVAARVE